MCILQKLVFILFYCSFFWWVVVMSIARRFLRDREDNIRMAYDHSCQRLLHYVRNLEYSPFKILTITKIQFHVGWEYNE